MCIPQGANAVTPFAHPATINASIAMGAVLAINNLLFMNPTHLMNAPSFRMMQSNLPTQPPTRPVRKVFRSKMYCTTCGWRKNVHSVDEGKGQKPQH
jgi:hypothetical protein